MLQEITAYQALHPEKPCVYLGIGDCSPTAPTLTGMDRQILSRQNVWVITRTASLAENLTRLLKRQDITCLPCPAIFSSQPTAPRRRTGRTALITQAPDYVNQEISRPLYERLRKHLAQDDEIDLITTHRHEWHHYRAAGFRPHHAVSPDDFVQQLTQYDRVISTRLHGAIAALSLKCTAAIVCDRRNHRITATVDRFGRPWLPIIQPEDEWQSLPLISPHLLSLWQQKTAAAYKTALAPFLKAIE
jgi:hypothetical protein